MDWEKAHNHVLEVLKQYRALIGFTNVNPYLGIAVLDSLLKRYESGERTEDLYESMITSE